MSFNTKKGLIITVILALSFSFFGLQHLFNKKNFGYFRIHFAPYGNLIYKTSYQSFPTVKNKILSVVKNSKQLNLLQELFFHFNQMKEGNSITLTKEIYLLFEPLFNLILSNNNITTDSVCQNQTLNLLTCYPLLSSIMSISKEENLDIYHLKKLKNINLATDQLNFMVDTYTIFLLYQVLKEYKIDTFMIQFNKAVLASSQNKNFDWSVSYNQGKNTYYIYNQFVYNFIDNKGQSVLMTRDILYNNYDSFPLLSVWDFYIKIQ